MGSWGLFSWLAQGEAWVLGFEAADSFTETTLTNCGFLGKLVLTCHIDTRQDSLRGVLMEEWGRKEGLVGGGYR